MKSQFTFRKLKSLLYLPSILYQNHFILSSMKETNQLIRPLVSNYSTQKAIEYTQGTTKMEPFYKVEEKTKTSLRSLCLPMISTVRKGKSRTFNASTQIGNKRYLLKSKVHNMNLNFPDVMPSMFQYRNA